MKLSEYQGSANKTWCTPVDKSKEESDTFIGLGVQEEVGELASAIRKPLQAGNFHQKPLDIENIKEETGDILYYISLIATHFGGHTLKDIANSNIKKIFLIYNKEQNEKEVSDFNEYQNLALQTIRPEFKDDPRHSMLTACFGVSKEIGFIMHELGEKVIDHNQIRNDKLVEKLGDALWYCSFTANTFDFTLDECAKENIEKTQSRYSQKHPNDDHHNSL